MVKQTAGRDSLGEFAPQFAALNDDVLFGQVWSRENKLSLRDRSLVTASVLMGKGILDDSLRYHLISARNNGISRAEMAEILTHAAFYGGWSNAWAVFKMAKKSMPTAIAPPPMAVCAVWANPTRHMPPISPAPPI